MIGCSALDQISPPILDWPDISPLLGLPICDHTFNPSRGISIVVLDSHSPDHRQRHSLGCTTESIPPLPRHRLCGTHSTSSTLRTLKIPVDISKSLNRWPRENRRWEVWRCPASGRPDLICKAIIRSVRCALYVVYQSAHNNKARQELRWHLYRAVHHRHTFPDTTAAVHPRSPASKCSQICDCVSRDNTECSTKGCCRGGHERYISL